MRVLVALFGLALSVPVIAQPADGGFKYGGTNCGCLTNGCLWTAAKCRACCNGAVIPSGPLTPGEVTQCIAFCNQMGQPCCYTP